MIMPLVLVEPLEPGVSVVTLNRPERRNALNIALMRELCEAVQSLAADPRERVVILRGAGTAFCAGLDLQEAADPQLIDSSADCVKRTLSTIRETSLITIAAAHGGAIAGGAGLMAACDLAVAADDLKIGFPEVRRGLVPALVSTVLCGKLRDGDVRELFLLGEFISAERAREIGLVQRVVPAEQVFAEAQQLARTILLGGPESVRQTKRLLNLHANVEADERVEEFIASHLQARRSEEAREGAAAFLEKRPPNWR
jgi:methylglutaconyl-CoA hydratase